MITYKEYSNLIIVVALSIKLLCSFLEIMTSLASWVLSFEFDKATLNVYHRKSMYNQQSVNGPNQFSKTISINIEVPDSTHKSTSRDQITHARRTRKISRGATIEGLEKMKRFGYQPFWNGLCYYRCAFNNIWKNLTKNIVSTLF